MGEVLVLRSGLETNSLILNKLAKDFIFFKMNGYYEKQLESLYNDTLFKIKLLPSVPGSYLYHEQNNEGSLTMALTYYKNCLFGKKNISKILSELDRPLRSIVGAELGDLENYDNSTITKDLYISSFHTVLTEYLETLRVSDPLLTLEENKENVINLFIKEQLELVNGLVLEDSLDYTCFLQIKSALNFVGNYAAKESLETTYTHFKEETRNYIKSLLSLTVSTKMDSGKERYISFIKQRCNGFDEYYNVGIKKNWII